MHAYPTPPSIMQLQAVPSTHACHLLPLRPGPPFRATPSTGRAPKKNCSDNEKEADANGVAGCCSRLSQRCPQRFRYAGRLIKSITLSTYHPRRLPSGLLAQPERAGNGRATERVTAPGNAATITAFMRGRRGRVDVGDNTRRKSELPRSPDKPMASRRTRVEAAVIPSSVPAYMGAAVTCHSGRAAAAVSANSAAGRVRHSQWLASLAGGGGGARQVRWPRW